MAIEDTSALVELLKQTIEISSALLTPTVAIFGLYIARQQYRLNKIKIDHELYEPRRKMYEAVDEFIKDIQDREEIDDDVIEDFLKHTRAAKPLLNRKACRWLDKLRGTSVKTYELQQKLREQKNPIDGQQQKYEEQYFKNMVWMSGQDLMAYIHFSPYITVKH